MLDRISAESNYLAAVAPEEAVNLGTLRETFVFMAIDNYFNMNGIETSGVFASKNRDFETVHGQTFEGGGKSKSFKQIAKVEQSYVIADDILFGEGRKIPMWLLGFLW